MYINLGNADLRWHPATDQLVGTDVYGTADEPTNDWSIAFDTLSYDQYLFATSDCEKWLVSEKEQVLGWYANEDREIVKSSTSEEAYTAKWYRREGSAEDPWISLSDHHDELQRVAFVGDNDNDAYENILEYRFHELSQGHYKTNYDTAYGYMRWSWMRGGPAPWPEYNFEIRLNIKILGNSRNMGLFNIFGVRNGGGHDRHIGIIGGRPYFRTWPGSGYYGNFNGVNVFDGQFHEWKLNCQTGLGQVATIDGVTVATNGYDHSNFHWKDSIRIGHSYDIGANFYGEMKDIEIIDLNAG